MAGDKSEAGTDQPPMSIYLGAISPNVMKRARLAAPSYRFGATWTPAKMTDHDWPYILDNGVYSAWVSGEEWDRAAWLETLGQLDDMPRRPEFAVLPDVVGDAEETYRRAEEYVEMIPADVPMALAAQDGMAVEEAVLFADDLGCEWIFVGGTAPWKHETADQWVMTAHDYGLRCHIARPGLPGGLQWARAIGADSVDTTTVARNRAWRYLHALEEQQVLGDYSEAKP